MQIKGSDGQCYHVTGQNQGNFNTVGAAAGIASLLGIDLGSILGNRWNPNMSADALVAALSASKNGSNDAVIASIISAVVSLIPQMMSNNQPTCSDNCYVTRYDQSLSLELQAEKSKNALLEADKYTDQKIVEATAYLQGEIGKVSDKLENFKEKQYSINLEQATINAKQTAAISCLNKQVDDIDAVLANLSKRVIPAYNVCTQTGATASCVAGAQILG